MKELQELIIENGLLNGTDIINVEQFISSQVDPVFMLEAGREFAAHFSGRGITKVATIESSGIAPAYAAALSLNVPLVIMKKQPARQLTDKLYQTEVSTYATNKTYELTLSEEVINSDDHVLILDDILADGEAVTGAIRLLRLAHATIAGLGVLIDKSYCPGHEKLLAQGIKPYSLTEITRIENGVIYFAE